MKNKHILLIVGGGIAAYKALDLTRRLNERGARVRGLLTKAGAQFITPLSLSALTGEKVHEDLFNLLDESEMGHIALSRAADLIVAAPATADLMAKMAAGLAGDLASTVLLATDTPVLVAPAMNVRMWTHTATRRNVAQLVQDGIAFVGPDEGDMACGEYGPGRMAEPLDIVAAIERCFERQESGLTHLHPKTKALKNQSAGLLAGRRVLVTAGPTHEPIDPVRYLANRSSGKQGFAIAESLAALGADVCLITGPVTLKDPPGIKTVRVETAADMAKACEAALPVDAAICAAAVADWRIAAPQSEKIKKTSNSAPKLALTENIDILKSLSTRKKNRPSLVIGFAAETEKMETHARQKLKTKSCDWIIANDVSPASGVMGGDNNEIMLITHDRQERWPHMTKAETGAALASRVADYFNNARKITPLPLKSKRGLSHGSN